MKDSHSNVLIMTGYAGLSGTLEALDRFENKLSGHFSKGFLKGTKRLKLYLLLQKAEEILGDAGADCFCEVGKYGIFATLWDFAKELDLGLKVDVKKIPIRQETVEITDHLDMNPYEDDGRGSFLIKTEYEKAEEIIDNLENKGINACIIGVFNNGNERVLINGGMKRYLTPASRIKDEKRQRGEM